MLGLAALARHPVRLVLSILALLVVAWLVVGSLVIVHPSVDKPTAADAIVVLGPPQMNGRLDVAKQLVAQGVASTVVVSVSFDNPKQADAIDYCQHPPTGVRVICFHAEPQSTRGEAEQTRQYVRQYGWHKVIVVTSVYHISRARMIFKRCFNGELLMVSANRDIGIKGWIYSFAYESASFVKAAIQNSC
ncbi:MAG: YdcF family protein [Actinomycetia bacterium]|nr:YdcF family protein [Actinomycetes bacterium]